MTKTSNSIQEQLENLKNLVDWFETQKEVDVEKGLIKVKEASVLIKDLRSKLGKVENEFNEIKQELEKI